MGDSVEVTWSFIVDYPPGWGVRRHSHDYFQMYYCTSGRGTMLLGEDSVELSENSCLIIHPDQIHELYPVESGRLQVIDTKFYIHNEGIRNSFLQVPQLQTIVDSHFRMLQQSARNEWGTGALYAKEMASLIFAQSILLLLRHEAPALDRPPFYRHFQETKAGLTGVEKQISDYLSLHFSEEVSLDQISQKLSYTKNYLCKIFKRTSGYTIHEYLTHLRICRAYDLICSTDERLTSISRMCGFSSIHHFSRTFRSIVGLTPSEIRDNEKTSLYMDIQRHGKFFYRYYKDS